MRNDGSSESTVLLQKMLEEEEKRAEAEVAAETAKLEAVRLEEEGLAKEAEARRLEAENIERLEKERLEALEQERLAKEAEAEKLEKERAEKEEQERLAKEAEEAEKLEKERMEQEEQERMAQEAEANKLEDERLEKEGLSSTKALERIAILAEAKNEELGGAKSSSESVKAEEDTKQDPQEAKIDYIEATRLANTFSEPKDEDEDAMSVAKSVGVSEAVATPLPDTEDGFSLCSVIRRRKIGGSIAAKEAAAVAKKLAKAKAKAEKEAEAARKKAGR